MPCLTLDTLWVVNKYLPIESNWKFGTLYHWVFSLFCQWVFLEVDIWSCSYNENNTNILHLY